ncbi:MAG: MFS transporter [Desulfovibrionaceae bacterium]|nr:MFS transporter [Desulfovibrionaceae bacterium]
MTTENNRHSGERLWNAEYLKVLAANFSMSFAFFLLTPLLPLYLSENFNAAKDIIGIILSGYTVTALLVRPFSGYAVDSFPRKKVLLVCLFLYFIFFGGYLLAGTLMLFALVRTLHGGPFGAFTVANNTAAIDVLPPSRRNEGIGFYGLGNNVAMAIAPTVGICIYEYAHNFDILFWAAFLVAGLGLVVGGTVKIPPRPPVAGKRPLSLDRFFLLKGWLIGFNMAFFGYCYGVLSHYLAIYGKEVMGVTDGIGTFFMLFSIGLILSRLQGAKALRSGCLTRNAAEGVIISTGGYVLFVAWPGEIGYYVSALLIGLGNGHIWPAFLNMIVSVSSNNERGTATSTLLTSWDLGIGFGILFGGVAAEYFGYISAFWSAALFHAAGALLFFAATRKFFLRKTQQNNSNTDAPQSSAG